MSPINEIVGTRLDPRKVREAMTAAEVNSRRLAELLSISESGVSKMLGRISEGKTLYNETCASLAAALNVSVSDLETGER